MSTRSLIGVMTCLVAVTATACTGDTAPADQGAPAELALSPVVPFPAVIVLGPDGRGAPGPDPEAMDADDLVGTTWRVLDPAAGMEPYYADSDLFASLTFDGSRWAVRDCGLDLSAPGTAGEQVRITGEWELGPDPDPGAACASAANSGGWVDFMGGHPWISRSGQTLVLSRDALGDSWAPDDLLPVPVGLTSVPLDVREANDEWTRVVSSGGIVVDYQPLASPEDALARADAVVVAEITATELITGVSDGVDRLGLRATVTEVISGDVREGEEVRLVIETNPPQAEALEEAPAPRGAALLVLRETGDRYVPFVDGLWLDGVDGPVGPRSGVDDLPPAWAYPDTVQSLTHDLRNAAADRATD